MTNSTELEMMISVAELKSNFIGNIIHKQNKIWRQMNSYSKKCCTPSTISSHSYYWKFLKKKLDELEEMMSKQRHILVLTTNLLKTANFPELLNYVTQLEVSHIFITGFRESYEILGEVVTPNIFLNCQTPIERTIGELWRSFFKVAYNMECGFDEKGYSMWSNMKNSFSLYESDVAKLSLLITQATDYEGVINLRNEVQVLTRKYVRNLMPIEEMTVEV